jgi:ATP-dependent Clp protease ATP-binding subunit ClpA
MAEQGYKVAVDAKARERLADIGYDKKYGARPLKRAITTNVENLISKAILYQNKTKSDKIRITFNKKDGEFVAK